jgi:hypothetical protein
VLNTNKITDVFHRFDDRADQIIAANRGVEIRNSKNTTFGGDGLDVTIL